MKKINYLPSYFSGTWPGSRPCRLFLPFNSSTLFGIGYLALLLLLMSWLCPGIMQQRFIKSSFAPRASIWMRKESSSIRLRISRRQRVPLIVKWSGAWRFLGKRVGRKKMSSDRTWLSNIFLLSVGPVQDRRPEDAIFCQNWSTEIQKLGKDCRKWVINNEKTEIKLLDFSSYDSNAWFWDKNISFGSIVGKMMIF